MIARKCLGQQMAVKTTPILSWYAVNPRRETNRITCAFHFPLSTGGGEKNFIKEEFARHIFQLPGRTAPLLAMRVTPNRTYPNSWTKSRFSTSVLSTVYRLLPRLGSITGSMNGQYCDLMDSSTFERSLMTSKWWRSKDQWKLNPSFASMALSWAVTIPSRRMSIEGNSPPFLVSLPRNLGRCRRLPVTTIGTSRSGRRPSGSQPTTDSSKGCLIIFCYSPLDPTS